jgi:hypothetical protein
MNLFRSHGVARRWAVVAGALAVTFAFAGTAAAAPTREAPGTVLSHRATINTHREWDGLGAIAGFGNPNSGTFGQTITIPAGKTTLRRFNFYLGNFAGTRGTMVMRAEVYAWNGREATGPALWESAPRTIAYGDDRFHKEPFHTGGVPVNAGEQYVVFGSVSKDFDKCTPGYLLQWGYVNGPTYPDGSFVFLNNGGDPSQWRTVPWTVYDYDLALKVVLV